MPKLSVQTPASKNQKAVSTVKSNTVTTSKLLFILIGILLLVIALGIAGAYMKNYKSLKKIYSAPPRLDETEYLRLEFRLRDNKLALTKSTKINTHPSVTPSKPDDGYQVTATSDNQPPFEMYIHKTQDPLFAIVPSVGKQIIVKDIRTNSQILTLNYPDILQNSQKETTPVPAIKRNVAKDALLLTFQQIKSKLTKNKTEPAEQTPFVVPFYELESYQQAKNDVIFKLPYQKGDASIEYSPRAEVIVVAIGGKTIDEYRENKKEAESYLKGLHNNLCDLHLIWQTNVSFNDQLLHEDITTTGCSS